MLDICDTRSTATWKHCSKCYLTNNKKEIPLFVETNKNIPTSEINPDRFVWMNFCVLIKELISSSDLIANVWKKLQLTDSFTIHYSNA